MNITEMMPYFLVTLMIMTLIAIVIWSLIGSQGSALV